jgi:hypothetical protein
MRGILICALFVLILAAVGWITFSWSANRASVNVETEKIQRDTEHIVESGKTLVKEVREPSQEAAPRQAPPAPDSSATVQAPQPPAAQQDTSQRNRQENAARQTAPVR